MSRGVTAGDLGKTRNQETLPREGNGSEGRVLCSLKGHSMEDGASTEGRARGNACACGMRGWVK